ncbi:hypothetical protein [Streptomyces sp. NPDC058953]|uniref:hypothetical protein n=1 Tax=unclassified Streptomyces TaxID=2593676 RepID=UPI00367C7928
MSSVKERLLVVMLFAPESGFLAALIGGGILEWAQGHAPSTSALWSIGLTGFAVVAGLIWYGTGRQSDGKPSGLPDDRTGDYSSCGGD